MPFALMLFYRLLGILLWVLILVMLWEKYRIIRGGTLLPGRILDCRKATRHKDPTPGEPAKSTRRDAFINPRAGAGGYCYHVEIFVNGQRMERDTSDSFWSNHDNKQGSTVLVWYNPAYSVVERKSWETEILAAGMAVVATALLLVR